MDNGHNCQHCHEIVRSPDQHTCGRTPQGTLPSSQPHKTPGYRSTAPTALPPSMANVLAGFRAMAKHFAGIKPPSQTDFTLAGPEDES